jgi:hypothetical protein
VKNTISVYYYEPKSTEEIQKKWSILIQSADNSAFLDWHWIISWLNTLPILPIIIEAKYCDNIVGLALLYKSSRAILPAVTIQQLWLHRTGEQQLDQVWMEHNDFLLDKRYAFEIREAMLQFIKNEISFTWHEFHVGMSSQNTIDKMANILGQYRSEVTNSDYSVDLSNFNTQKCYLACLSKNTRSQINRSFKLLCQEGELTLTSAQNFEQKEKYFTQMAQLHQQKWRNTEEGSGFDNPSFVSFHKELIFNDVKNIYSQVFCLSVNKFGLAYIYVLKTTDSWSFYLSGIKNHKDNKIKVGLLAHTLVIEQAIEQGLSKYSFLAGYARYKQSLSNVIEEPQSLVCFNSKSKRMWCLQKLRWIKSFFRPANNS